MLNQLGYPEDKVLNPPPRKVVTKGAPKRVRFTLKVTSMGRIPSTWEHLDSQNPDCQSSQPKSKFSKSKGARLGTYSRSSFDAYFKTKTFFEYTIHFTNAMIMRPFIEEIVNVKGDGNCEFRVIARHMGMIEENHVLVRHALIHELKNHKSDYLSIFDTEKHYKYILDGLHPPTSSSGIVLEDKWLTFLDMVHIITTCYNRFVVQLILLERGIC